MLALTLTACFPSGSIGSDGSVVDADVSRFDAAPTDADPPDATPLVEGVVTLVGSAMPGDIDGERNVARLNNPVNLAVAANGEFYVSDFNNGTIRRVTPSGMVTTITRAANFARPFGIIFDGAGQLYVQTDADSHGTLGGALWRVNPVSGAETLLLDDVGRPRGLEVLGDGRLVMVDYISNVVRLWNPEQSAPTFLAGTAGSAGYVDATGSAARFNEPVDVVIDGDGNLIVADLGNNVLRKITVEGVVTTFAGNGVAASVDGGLLAASFDAPKALAIGNDGRIYVTETGGHVIRMVADGQVTTIAGDGVAGFRDGDPLSAEFFALEGLDVAAGYLYIADGNGGEESEPYNRIRRVSLP